jgi:hypothetical protein
VYSCAGNGRADKKNLKKINVLQTFFIGKERFMKVEPIHADFQKINQVYCLNGEE